MISATMHEERNSTWKVQGRSLLFPLLSSCFIALFNLFSYVHIFFHLVNSIHKQLQNLASDRAKTPRLNDRRWVHIDLILTHLQSFNRGSFRAGQKPNFDVVYV